MFEVYNFHGFVVSNVSQKQFLLIKVFPLAKLFCELNSRGLREIHNNVTWKFGAIQ